MSGHRGGAHQAVSEGFGETIIVLARILLAGLAVVSSRIISHIHLGESFSSCLI